MPPQIGRSPWTRGEMMDRLEEFAGIYAKRPIQDNSGGMSSAHLFPFWFVLQYLKPRAVIESGVWRGQGTWLIEQACPTADIYCIDINWKNLQYSSARAKYLSEDISLHDWSHLPKDETVVFFDDHINEFERFQLSVERGFRHVLFEDNYPPGQGDCYSIKKVLAHTGHRAFPGVKAQISRMLGRMQDRTIHANTTDADYIRQHADVVEELPPIFKHELTRWGDPWDERYPTVEPLLNSIDKPYQQTYFDEAGGYTWLCYARLSARS